MQPTPHLRIVVDNVARHQAAQNVVAPVVKRRDAIAAFLVVVGKVGLVVGRVMATAWLTVRFVAALPILAAAAMLRVFYGTVLFLFGLAVLATLWLGPLKAVVQTITG